MNKKYLAIFIIICVFNLTSCYSVVKIHNPSTAHIYNLSEYDRIVVKTEENNVYRFKEGSFNSDSFIGTKLHGKTVEINKDKISQMKLKKYKKGKTILLILVPIVLIGVGILCAIPWGLRK